MTADAPGNSSSAKALLVGYGSIGRRHLTNFHQLGVHDWAVVHTGVGTVPFEPRVPVRTYARLDEALGTEEPDFAVIANPTAFHVSSALACAERGCDLLLEKPVSHTLDRLDVLAGEVAKRRNRVLVGFQFRFDPALAKIKQVLRERTIGKPIHARIVWGEYLPDWHPWEDWRTSYAARQDLGGGVHHTICHPFDYLRLLFGEVTSVRGALSESHALGLDVAEAADILLQFRCGVDAVVHLDYWSQPQVHRVEIVCSAGSIAWDYIGGSLGIWDSTSGVWRTEAVPGVEQRNALFLAVARHFLAVVDGLAEPACTLENGIQAVRIAEAIERSSERNSERVKL